MNRGLSELASPVAGRPARIFRSVYELLRSGGAIRPGERLVLGVSGGADSTALALLLSTLRLQEFLAVDLHIAHFNHQLRTEAEAAEDQEFVRALAARLEIPFSAGAADVPSFARRRHLSLEDAARRLRYCFLAEEAERLGAPAVAVGHTADDQAETVLLHVIRGAGLRGLRGMTLRAEWPFGKGPDLIRPLIRLRRADTEFYCRKAGIEPRADPTNETIVPSRNRVRQQILPVMRELNPRVDEALLRLAQSVETDVDYLERQAADAWDTLAVRTDDAIQFQRGQFEKLDPALAWRLLARAVRDAGAEEAQPAFVQLEKAATLGRSTRSRWTVSFPGGVTVAGRSRVIRVARDVREQMRAIPATPLPLSGAVEVSDWRVTLDSAPLPATLSGNPYALWLDAAMVRGQLLVRSRRHGDRMRPVGLGGTKKVQDILVDRKVPLELRDRLPLICDDAGILWIPGHCIDERAAATQGREGKIRVVVKPLRGPRRNATMTSRARRSKGPEGP